MVQAVVENVHVPITAKIRIGINQIDIDILKIAKNCERTGASAIIIHARSAREGFSGSVH